MREEAEHAQPVVYGHEHYVLGSPFRTLELRLEGPALAQAAAVDEHRYRKLRVGLARSLGPDVQVETVLAVCRLLPVTPFGGVSAGVVGHLVARMPVFVGHLDAFPGHYGLRLLPPQVADRGCGVGYALEYGDSFDFGFDTLDLPAFDSEYGAGVGGGRTSDQGENRHCSD